MISATKVRKYFGYSHYIIWKFLLFLHILLNPVSCGADGLLGDAHDAADVAVFHAHLVEDEEEGVMGGFGSIFLLDATERGEVDGLIKIDEAFVVIVRPTRSSTIDIDFIVKPKKSSKKLHNPTTFTIFAPMKRKIRTYGGYFEAFMETLKEKEQEKIQYGLLLLKSQDRLPKKFVKLVRDGIYELRTEYGGNIYRVFFIFDEGEIVVLFNGFQKKTQKTPQNEIEKAIKIKEAYYADKQSQNR